jgi:serine/threonine-protein kinase
MKERRLTETGDIDPASAQEIARICSQFEGAWKEALTGSQPPELTTYLNRVSPAHRPALQQDLKRIERQHQQHGTSTVRLDPSGKASTARLEPRSDVEQVADPSDRVTLELDLPAGETPSGATIHSSRRQFQISASPGEPGADVIDFSLSEPAVKTRASQWPEVPGYEIAGEIGRGGMGVVYKARQKGLNRWTALKMVLAGAHATQEQLARFQTEAEAVALLQHPNIVQIYDVGEHAGLPYFSLEYIDGGALARKIHREPQPPREAAHLVEMLADAMHYAHQHGVIHRDLKPANVLLTPDGQPKITDFGLAKRLEGDSSQTKSGTLMGTPSYMAPEQARRETHAIGPLADVYALGAMLYELLTGRPPFLAATPMETVMRVMLDEPMPPTRLAPKVPRDLETICLKCLQKEPHKRYASAGLLAEDLRRFLAEEPILARPVGNAERLWRWCRRNPRVALLTAAVLLLLVTVTATSSTSYFRVKREQEETQRQKNLADEYAYLQQKAAEEAREAKGKAEVNATIASEQRALALGTLYSLVTKVEDKLRDKADMNDLRKDILSTAMEGLKKVSKSVETAPTVDRSMGVALQRMGDNYEQMGQTEETMRLYKQSLEIFNRLETEDPGNDWIKWDQAISYDKLGSLSHEFHGDAATALDDYHKSLALRQILLSEPHPVTPEFPVPREIALIVSYNKLANFAREMGDPAKARDYASKCLETSEAVLAAAPTDRRGANFQGHSYYMLGKANAHLNAKDEARKDFERCLELRQRAVHSDPTSADAKRELGAVYDAWGDMEVERGNPKAALQHYSKAFELYQGLHKKQRDNAENQWYLAHVYSHRGTAKSLLGDAAAAKDFAESLKLCEVLAKTDPRNMQRQTDLMLARARHGLHVEAGKAAEGLRRRASKNPAVLFTVACGYALCSEAVADGKSSLSSEDRALQHRYALAGLQTLDQAVGLGYRDVEALQLEPDLGPLRKVPGFETVLTKARQASVKR